MFLLRKRTREIRDIVTTTCRFHAETMLKLQSRMARLEGENVAILALLAIVLLVVVERL